jgi:hypothetical protein
MLFIGTKALGAEYKRTFRSFEEMMSSDNDYLVYYSTVNGRQPPILPCLGTPAVYGDTRYHITQSALLH